MRILLFVFIIFTTTAFGQEKTEVPFKSGEWLKYRLHYGMVTAGYATLQLNEIDNHYLAEADGWVVGMFNWFFKVKDHYESHIDRESLVPNLFIRDVYEGGYTINRTVKFDRKNNLISVEDLKEDERTDSVYVSSPTVGDMLSSFYFARTLDSDTLKINDRILLDVFMDYDIYKFSLKFLGREIIETEFGNIRCLKFAPVVQSGRVFKDDESVLMWISDDDNKILVKVVSALKVGSIKVSLVGFKGLKNSFKVTHE